MVSSNIKQFQAKHVQRQQQREGKRVIAILREQQKQHMRLGAPVAVSCLCVLPLPPRLKTMDEGDACPCPRHADERCPARGPEEVPDPNGRCLWCPMSGVCEAR